MQTTFESGGRTIRLEVLEPHGARPHPAILLLHGAGGNTDFWLDRLAPILSRTGIAFFALHYFDRTGTTRADLASLTDGKHVPLWLDTVRDALTAIGQRPGIDSKRIALVGISLGAYLSLAVATLTGTPRIKAIIDVSGGLVPPFDAAATSSFPPTLILHGDADTIVPVANALTLDALLTRLNVTHETHVFRGDGHWFSPPSHLRIIALIAGFLSRFL